MNSNANMTPAGNRSFAPWIASGSAVISKVPVEKNRARMPTSINALPRMVNMRNFIAEYSRLLFGSLPQMAIRKNIGMSSSSQNRKNSRKSSDVKTPITPVWSASSHMKYSRTRLSMLHDASAATSPSSPVSNTIGALMPSTPRKYWTAKASASMPGIQLGMRSMNWMPPASVL